MTEKYCLKIGEKLKLFGVLKANGTVISNLDVTIFSQARTRNTNEAYSFTYQSLEVDEETLGKYQLELDTTGMASGQYNADVKYVLSDGSVHFDDTFEIELKTPETRT